MATSEVKREGSRYEWLHKEIEKSMKPIDHHGYNWVNKHFENFDFDVKMAAMLGFYEGVRAARQETDEKMGKDKE